MRKIQIGVIGPSKINYPLDKNLAESLDFSAEKIGKLLAQNDTIVVTGGSDGVMEAASRGAKLGNGLVIGTPGPTRNSSNKYTDIEILTPISVGDFLFAGILTSDVLIVAGESAGTTAELALAYRYCKKMIILEGYSNYYDSLIDGYLDNKKCTKFVGAKTPEEAVSLALEEAKKYLEKLK